jgi:hypothetical protein
VNIDTYRNFSYSGGGRSASSAPGITKHGVASSRGA